MPESLAEQLIREMTDGFAHHEVICDASGTPVDYRFLMVNPAFETLTGLKAAAVVGKTVREVLPGIDRFWIDTFGTVALTGQKTRFEHFSNVLGRHFDVRAYQASPGHFTCVFTDITEYELSRKALRENQVLLAKVQEIAGIGHWTLDLTTNRLTWSDEVYRIFGFAPQDFAGTYEAFLDAVHPDDRESVDAAYAGSLRDGSDHYEAEHRIVRRDTGDIGYVLERCLHTRDAGGAVIRSTGMVQDLTARWAAETARRASEEKLHNIVTLLPQAIYEADLTGRLTYANRAAFELFGYQDSDLAAGVNIVDTVIPEDAARARENVAKLFTGQEPENSEYTARRKDGSTFPVIIYSSLAKQGDTPVGLRGVIVDISKRKSYERVLEKALAAAEQASRAKDEFLSNISHELRTPISAIVGFAELLGETPLAEQQRHYLSTITSSAETLLALVNDLLDIARVESGQFEVQSEEFALRELVAECLDSQSPRAAGKGLAIHSQIGAEVPNCLVGDQLRLRQIVLNLLGNAVKFTREGEITLTVAVEQEQDRQVVLRFEVTDTGIGIRAEDFERIFQPFSQLDTSLSRKFDGVGLGLAICRELATLMGGEISVWSREGVGSTFVLLLPFALGQPASRESLRIRSTGATSLWHGETLRVLVAEDYEVTQTYLREVLTRHGHQADIVGSGIEAIEMWQKSRYDLILMDVQMPVLDGIGAVGKIREMEGARGGHIPIIALTAHAMEEDRLDFLSKGFDGYVSKPMKMDELFNEMKRCLKSV